jgi:PAS domain S-box-containing protein
MLNSLKSALTGEQKTAIKLREKREELMAIFKASPDPVLVYDSLDHVQYLNDAFTTTFGWNLNEVKGIKIPFIPEGLQKVTSDVYFNDTGKIKDTEIRFETKRYTKDGKLLNVSLSAAPIKGNRGEMAGIVVNIKDITKTKKSEIQLQQAQKMEAIGTLAGGIAHDFNNILFPIMGHTEILLMDTPEDSSAHGSLKKIYSGANRAKELVKQILTFSRQESCELILMKMQPVVKEVLKLIRSTVPTTIEIKQDINSKCGMIKADPTQIHQIVMNLATNAYHAMEEHGGELKVNLKEIEIGEEDVITPDMIPGAYACLTIADTGIGMEQNLIDKIFEPFFTTKGKGKGTGMGLSTVHGIVTKMGGAINVNSLPGKGTEFNLYFLLEKSSFEEQVTNSKAEIQGGTEHILVVDDEEAILTMEKQVLERLGYRVTSRTSSIEALEAFRDSPDKFDLVITDMAMPNMPGDKLSAELTKIRPGIPVLLCTGFSESMSEEKAASLGIKVFLVKPIVMKDLFCTIREVLDNNKSEIEN